MPMWRGSGYRPRGTRILSAQALLQFNNAAHLGVGNMRLRYRFAEGSDLYVVYNDELNVDRLRLMPQSPELPLSPRDDGW